MTRQQNPPHESVQACVACPKGALPPQLRAVAAVSPPVDLSACADAIERPQNRLYLHRFMRMLGDGYRRRHRARDVGEIRLAAPAERRRQAEQDRVAGRGAASERTDDPGAQIILGVAGAVVHRQLIRRTEGHAARNDRDTLHSVGARHEETE